MQQADQACTGCPLFDTCLYDAVVRFDVAGFVAGTTARDRDRIRRRLHVKVEAEDLDALTGASSRNRQVDHDEVLRLRAAHPEDSLNALARRLGCSLSTVKRHLRQGRQAPTVRSVEQTRPSVSDVRAAWAAITARTPADKRVAA